MQTSRSSASLGISIWYRAIVSVACFTKRYLLQFVVANGKSKGDTMAKKEVRHIRSMSPREVEELVGLSLTEDETRAFSDGMLVSQQFLKYIFDYNSGKTTLTNKDEERWFRRFIYDVLQRPALLDYINSGYLNSIRGVILEMTGLGLSFPLECLEADNLYERTMPNMADKKVSSFRDITIFMGECDDAVLDSLKTKIAAISDHDISYVVMD
jgi:hypothetical protein